MSRLEIHMNEFKRAFKMCKPKLEVKSSGQLIHNQCILHKYLKRTTVGRSVNFAGCIGGPICVEIMGKLGLGNHSSCETIHKMVYDLIRKRGTVRI